MLLFGEVGLGAFCVALKMAKKFKVNDPDNSSSSSEGGKKKKWLAPLLWTLLVVVLLAAIIIPIVIVYTKSVDIGNRIACFPLLGT